VSHDPGDDRLRAALAAAEEANRLKDEFLAVLSHELRTPLNAILGWARMLRAGMLTGEDAGRALETIERNAQAQAQLIEDLLDVSRIVSGKLRLDMRTVDVAEVVSEATDTVRPTADARGVTLTSAVSPAGPVSGDAQRLQQVVWNLLANSIKFTPVEAAELVTVIASLALRTMRS
jgi:signal transduction histidine kinase